MAMIQYWLDVRHSSKWAVWGDGTVAAGTKLSYIKIIFLTVLLFIVYQYASACTIFVLTSTDHAFFCNNEDWLNHTTRIWFIPGGKDHYGAVYVGFKNGAPQGVLNTEGLASDWVAYEKENWEPDSGLLVTRGFTDQRMLERCSILQTNSGKDVIFTI